MIGRLKSGLAVQAVVVLFVTTLCATGAMTAYRFSAPPIDVLPVDQDGGPVVAPRPQSELPLHETNKGLPIADGARTAYQVRLASDGLLPGRLNVIDPITGDLVPAERVTVHVMQHGKVVKYVKPGVHGVFQVTGLKPGVYSIVVSGERGFLAYAVEVLPPAENPQTLINEPILQIDGVMVLRQDIAAMKSVLQAYAPVPSLAGAETEQAEDLLPTKKLDDGGLPPSSETPLRDHIVTISADGRVVGRVCKLDPETGAAGLARAGTMFFIRDGQLVGQTEIDGDGMFAISGLRSGVYSVVAAGKYGFAAFAIHAKEMPPSLKTVRQDESKLKLASATSAPSTQTLRREIQVALTSHADFHAAGLGADDSRVGIDSCCCEECEGPGGTPAAGGGGHHGGVGLLGLLGLLGLIDDDDDGNPPPFNGNGNGNDDDDDLKSPYDPFYQTPN